MSPLRRVIAEAIAQDGPISVERYMRLSLSHPLHGYYRTRDPFGRAGDFVTAPEISQMFGEFIGLWAVECWSRMGRPPRLSLVELGPGRGTLLADALRAARVLPECRAALSLHLVETSRKLRAQQSASLADCALPIAWHERLDEVPAGPMVVIANEFFDALPIRQFTRQAKAWHERLIGLCEDSSLAFGLSPKAELSLALVAAEGAVLEISPEGIALAGALARRVVADGGAALIIDYGHVKRGFGDTLQAVQAHGFADPLASPGEADLTAHVDFAALGEAARKEGAVLHGPVTQGDYLRALGIETRARRLKSAATLEQATAIDAALARLAGEGEGEMGALFKAMAISDPRLGSLAGFAAGR